MDWYPLYNLAAYRTYFHGYHLLRGDCGGLLRCASAARAQSGVLDVLFTLPLVLPPTVVGYLLLRVLRTEKSRRRMGARAF